MSRLARFVVRRRRAVIVSWVLLLIVTATIGSSAFSVLSSDFGAGSSTESGRVAKQVDDLAEVGGQLAIIADGIDTNDPVDTQSFREVPDSRLPAGQLVNNVVNKLSATLRAALSTDQFGQLARKSSAGAIPR